MPKDIYLRWYVKYGNSWAGFQFKKHADSFYHARFNSGQECEIWDNDTQTQAKPDA